MKVIRWISFLPAFLALFSFLTLMLRLLYDFSITVFEPTNESVIYVILFPIGMLAAWFAASIISCFIAPDYKIRISIVYYVFTCFFIVGTMTELSYEVMSPWYVILSYICSLIGVFGSIMYQKRKSNEAYWKFTKTAWGFMLFGTLWIATCLILIAFNPGTEYGYFSEGGAAATIFGIIYIIVSSTIHLKAKKSKQITKIDATNMKYLP